MNRPGLFDLIVNALFGWRRYRVLCRYKRPDGKELFHFTTTIGVRFASAIEDHKAIKQEVGPVWKLGPSVRCLLCNGRLDVEPQCYLGRWHERASRGRGE